MAPRQRSIAVLLVSLLVLLALWAAQPGHTAMAAAPTARPAGTTPVAPPTAAVPAPDPLFASALAAHLRAVYARGAAADELPQAASDFAKQYYGAEPRYAFVSEGALPVLVIAPVVGAVNHWWYLPYLCWPQAGAVLCQGWPTESTLWFYLGCQPTQARVVQAGSAVEVGLISCPLGNSGQCSYALLRLSGGTWTTVWSSAEAEQSRRWFTDLGGEVRFLGEGVDSLLLRGRLPDDVPAARFFFEWRFAVLQEYLSLWQRRGDVYERVEGMIVESPVTALSEFMVALTQGNTETARGRALGPAVPREAAALGLDRLVPLQWAAMRDAHSDAALLLRDLNNHSTTDPVYRVTLTDVRGRWLVDGVEYLPTLTPTPRPPLPTATPRATAVPH